MSRSPLIVSIVGARPQFVKLAPIARAFNAQRGVQHQIVHTGQHYDQSMSASFFDQLNIPKPDVDLGVGSGSHADQTARMLTGLESYMDNVKPSAVLSYGDTNSTLAATLAATKIHVPIAHIEAGLRSYNRKMPEEINRIVSDHCSDRLYAPTPRAMQNLETENISDRAIQTGDVMLDAVRHNMALAAKDSRVLQELDLEPGSFGLVTVHRPVNTTAEALASLMTRLQDVADSQLPLVFPVHPRTRAKLESIGFEASGGLKLTEPFPYLETLSLIEAARIVITDSGGVQKEAAFLKTQCLTARDETEWTETVDLGINRLIGNRGRDLVSAMSDCLTAPTASDEALDRGIKLHYGDGNAAEIIVSDCVRWLDS